MPGTESACPTSVRALTGGASHTTVLAAMVGKLPADGMAAAQIGGRYRLLEATYRLLDSRILAAAMTCLDQDVGEPLAHWLANLRELRGAAEITRSDPMTPEATVVLGAGHRLSSTQTSEV